MKKLVSICHGAGVKMVGGVTRWYVCLKCGEPCDVKTEKTFHSMNVVKKFYFPKRYKKEMEEKAIEKLGFGKWLAKCFLSEIRRKIKEIK